jgi:Methyltransferase domain
MPRFLGSFRRVLRAPGVPQARHLAERAVAPYLRADVASIAADQARTATDQSTTAERVQRVDLTTNHRLHLLEEAMNSLQTHMPAVLNAIASTNGTARQFARQHIELERQLAEIGLSHSAGAEALAQLEASMEALKLQASQIEASSHRAAGEASEHADAIGTEIRNDLGPHLETLAFLLRRVETVRAEMLFELRYGPQREPETNPTVTIVNPDALAARPLRLNLGAGHIALTDFVNIDMRELPGIDVVAPIDNLPFEPSSVDEIFSSHTLEHFPEEQLKRQLLPYWVGLLAPGGTLRAIVPDIGAMIEACAKGTIPFAQFRDVAYGGQEYVGDFHHNGFTPESLRGLLRDVGLENVTLIAQGRPNGLCLEFEITARKPA